MKIRDKKAQLHQPLIYEYLFFENVHLIKHTFKNDNKPEKTNIQVRYRPYAVTKNKRVYKEEKIVLNLNDFSENSEITDALESLETALVNLITNKTELDIEKV